MANSNQSAIDNSSKLVHEKLNPIIQSFVQLINAESVDIRQAGEIALRFNDFRTMLRNKTANSVEMLINKEIHGNPIIHL